MLNVYYLILYDILKPYFLWISNNYPLFTSLKTLKNHFTNLEQSLVRSPFQ